MPGYSNRLSARTAITVSVILTICSTLALVLGVIRYFPAGVSSTEPYQSVAFVECIIYLAVASLGFATISRKKYWIVIFMVSCIFSTMFSLGGLIFNAYTVYDSTTSDSDTPYRGLNLILAILLAIVNVVAFITTLYSAVRCCGAIVGEDQQRSSHQMAPTHSTATHTVTSITY